MQNIKNKVVIITGASSGIGEETALNLAGAGAKLVLAARRKDRLENLIARINAGGGEAIAVATDVRDRAQVQALADAAVAKYGRIDALINNAGVMLMAPMSKLKIDEWDAMIDINVKGALYAVAAVLPAMQAQKSGHIINISSVAGLRVSAGVGTVYSATKFALKAISEGLRAELCGQNIRVTTLYPGAIATELTEHSSDEATKSAMKAFYAANEIGADSVARAIAYAINEPADVGINEITIRPSKQEF